MDYWEQIEVARSRLRVMRELLRAVERGTVEPIGQDVAGLYADWCEAIGQVLAQL